MSARIDGSSIIVDDSKEASQIYNRGWFGAPQPGGSLRLDLIEALYLLESGRIEVRGGKKRLAFEQLFRLGNKALENFEIQYLVYRDLRGRGYVVKGNRGSADFRVFPRGGSPSKTPSKWWVCALSERTLFSFKKILSDLSVSKGLRKNLLLAIVDEEGDVTYYEVKIANPSGRHSGKTKMAPTEALFTGDRVIIGDSDAGESFLRSNFFGKLLGDKLQLSLIEAAFLADRSLLVLRNSKTGRKISNETLKRHARRLQRDFDLRLKAYEDLKDRGLIVKTGFKYGSHFRAYEDDPNKMHARYLIHAVPKGYSAFWPEISRAIRLAHGVRKEILFGEIGSGGVEYLRLARCRP